MAIIKIGVVEFSSAREQFADSTFHYLPEPGTGPDHRLRLRIILPEGVWVGFLLKLWTADVLAPTIATYRVAGKAVLEYIGCLRWYG